ncbi:hypothetical protein [Sandarakinorhabdus sp.]|uniref:hypothetical protein n=1 Tax=Sandarakinorhabdus sp. TaxID=1916663 RepID=UPI003F6E8CF0
MSGIELNDGGSEDGPDSIAVNVATTGSLGISMPGPLIPDTYVTFRGWIESAIQAAKDVAHSRAIAGALADGSEAQSDSEDANEVSEGPSDPVQRAEEVCRKRLADGQVAASLITLEGETLTVCRSRWRSAAFWESAICNHPRLAVEPGSHIPGILIVEAHAAAVVLTKMKVRNEERTLDWTAELALMVRAVSEIPIRKNDRSITKGLIEEWFLKNMETGLKIKKTRIGQMASLLMDEELLKGGVRSNKDDQGTSKLRHPPKAD